MKSLGQLLMGLLTAASSSLLVLAAASLALAEGGVNLSVRPTSSSTPASVIASPIPGQTIAATRPITATNTPTETAHCQTPKDWSAYTVQPGDTLESLSAQRGLSTIDILKMNCLLSNTLLPNTILYLPFTNPTATETVPPGLPTAAPTLTRIPCSPPDGWVIYVVRSGENLYRLSLAFGVEPYVLQSANCLSGATIYTGQKLFVPNVPTRAPEFYANARTSPLDDPGALHKYTAARPNPRCDVDTNHHSDTNINANQFANDNCSPHR